MSQPPGPGPYDGPPQPHQPPHQPQPPQAPYGYPQQPPAYGQNPYAQPGMYPGYPQQPGYPNPYGYPQGGLPPGMPPLASWGARVGATLLDWLIFMLVPTGLTIAGYAQMAKKLVDRQDECDRLGIDIADCPTPDYPGSAFTLIAIGLLLSFVIGLFLCYREGATGQTPGKRIAGIRLLREHDGSTLGFGRAFGRRLLHALDSLPCGLGYLWPLWDGKKQTFADKLVRTVVIKDQS
ncbi:RDD family protein [Streptomyces sp.]|uniref:RDD family protein n=1 Tax=Streptomyces sp. TaxID=1931 RepID=UPI002F3FBA7D